MKKPFFSEVRETAFLIILILNLNYVTALLMSI